MQYHESHGIPIELERAYDEYYMDCEKRNVRALGFDQWRALRDKNDTH